MCGFVGHVGNGRSVGERQSLLTALDAMCRRGPDATGEWWDASGLTALGHRRLAIIDLDARANQPFVSADGRHVIVLNGEIYNFRELRAELEAGGAEFRTMSDTEVVLMMFARHGAGMLSRLRGMFALAVWDAVSGELFIARDPYGIKPLYVARASTGWLIASQVKALLATGSVSREPDPVGQAGYWLFGSVPEPHTWFRDINALPAGHYATISTRGMSAPVCWWDVADAWRSAGDTNVPSAEVPGRVRKALLESVEAHLVADVPVGVFLSGGIDSGSLAALMLEAGARELTGVTIAFDEFSGGAADETPRAERLARQYGIRHVVRRVSRREFESDLPRIMAAMDQPSVDGFNTWYASKAVAEAGLKVVVSGVGGDELFQGYNNFQRVPALVVGRRKLARLPGGLRLASLLSRIQSRRTGNPRWALLPRLGASIEGAWMLSRMLFTERELPGVMSDLTPQDLHGLALRLLRQHVGTLSADPRLAVGQLESVAYLRNQLLRDGDWASMDHSVELRTPLVDAWLLRDLQPVLGTFRRFPHKKLLSAAPNPPLDEELARAGKTGFGIPVLAWMGWEGNGEHGAPVRRFAEYVAANCY